MKPWSPAPEVPGWVWALEPATTGLLGHEGVKLWTGGRAALGIRGGGIVYPVFPHGLDQDDEEAARHVLTNTVEAWCVMGPAAWVARAETLLPPSIVFQRIEYEFLQRPLWNEPVPAGPGVLRKAEPSDGNTLFPLQEGYEKEEVLFDPEDFQPLASRMHLGKSLKQQEIVCLWDSGVPVAKAGTNALTASWAQIGGVYTVPERRGQGLQKRLMAFLLQRLARQGRAACLFVKKANEAALGLYRGLGFTVAGDYRITYGQRR